MCCGLSIIASDRIGAAADLVRREAHGFSYPIGDISTLADTQRRVLADENSPQVMGHQSLLIISPYGPAEDVKGVLKALPSATDRKG